MKIQFKNKKILKLVQAGCLKNASSLMNESQILALSKYYSRATFLCFTALEEIFKCECLILFSQGLIDQTTTEKIFIDHKVKLAIGLLTKLKAKDLQSNKVISSDREYISFIKRIGQINVIKGMMKARNKTLYVDVNKQHLHIPNLSKQEYEVTFQTAQIFYSYISIIKYGIDKRYWMLINS